MLPDFITFEGFFVPLSFRLNRLQVCYLFGRIHLKICFDLIIQITLFIKPYRQGCDRLKPGYSFVHIQETQAKIKTFFFLKDLGHKAFTKSLPVPVRRIRKWDFPIICHFNWFILKQSWYGRPRNSQHQQFLYLALIEVHLSDFGRMINVAWSVISSFTISRITTKQRSHWSVQVVLWTTKRQQLSSLEQSPVALEKINELWI